MTQEEKIEKLQTKLLSSYGIWSRTHSNYVDLQETWISTERLIELLPFLKENDGFISLNPSGNSICIFFK